MFNLNKVTSAGDGERRIFDKTGLTVDQLFEYFIGMVPIGEKQLKSNQINLAAESPRRKRKDPLTELTTYTETDVSDSITVAEAAEVFQTLTEYQKEHFAETLAEVLRKRINSSDWAFDVVLPLLEQGEVDLDIAICLVGLAQEEFAKEPALIDLNFEEGVETVVVGDIHGQFKDLLLIFKKFGRPEEKRRYIFNGDIIDRGPRSVACWLFICALKISCPQYLYVTRGNHESRTVNIMTSSFASECANNYSEDFFIHCQATFNELPLAYVLNKAIFVTHGGLPKDLCLNKARQMGKNSSHPSFDFTIFMALLWNDPTRRYGYSRNSRGPRVFSFGPNITEEFLQKHNLSLLIRSHEYQLFGHQYTHNSKCLTIFSSPDYENLGNTGAVALVDYKGNVKVEQFYE